MAKRRKPDFVTEVRRAVADYMMAEGCSCCRNEEKHNAAKKRLAELLAVPKFSDESGWDFYRFKTSRPLTASPKGRI